MKEKKKKNQIHNYIRYCVCETFFDFYFITVTVHNFIRFRLRNTANFGKGPERNTGTDMGKKDWERLACCYAHSHSIYGKHWAGMFTVAAGTALLILYLNTLYIYAIKFNKHIELVPEPTLLLVRPQLSRFTGTKLNRSKGVGLRRGYVKTPTTH